MRMVLERAVLTVVRHDGSWAVKFDDEMFGSSHDKEECKAAAHKRAQQIHNSGRACQVRVSGEHGYFEAQ